MNEDHRAVVTVDVPHDAQNGARAGAELADQLRRAWVHAGRPPMAEIGDLVGYSKATISKVLSGKMPPAWRLVRKLGDALGVPQAVVTEHWHALWAAADEYRRSAPDAGPLDGPPHGQACDTCGAWVVDAPLHAVWHLRLESTPEVTEAYRWAHLRDSLPRREKYQR